MKIEGKFRKLAIASLMAVALAVPVALAQSSGAAGQDGQGGKAWKHGEHGEHRGGEGRMFGALGLSDAQKATIKGIHQSHSASLKSLRDQIRSAHQQIHQSEENGTFNQAQVSQQLAAIAPVEAQLMAEEVQMRQQILAVLTPDQKAKLDQMRAQFKARHAEHGASQN